MYREIYGKEPTHSYEGGEVPQSARQAGDPGESIFQFRSRGKKRNQCPCWKAGRQEEFTLAEAPPFCSFCFVSAFRAGPFLPI